MVVLNRIYTRTGDAGETALGSGERVSKADLRIHAYGTVDEPGMLPCAAHAAMDAEAVQVTEPEMEPLDAFIAGASASIASVRH